MSLWLQVLAWVIVGGGAVGFVISLILVWKFHFWMGRRGAGWPRILFNTLMLILHALAFLFFVSLAGMGGLIRGGVFLFLNFTAAIVLSATPWSFIVALWRWWYPGKDAPALAVTPGKRGDKA